MKNWQNEDTDRLCDVLTGIKTREECYAILDDICTIKEILSISQRVSVAVMLDKGESYQDIVKQTGASSATISRVNKCYEYGSGGYKLIIDKLKGKK